MSVLKNFVAALVVVVCFCAGVAHADYMPTAAQLAAMDRLLERSTETLCLGADCTALLQTHGTSFTTGVVAFYARMNGEPIWRLEEWLCTEKDDTCLLFSFVFSEKAAVGSLYLFRMSTRKLLRTLKEGEPMNPTEPGAITSSEIAWSLLMRLGLPT